MKVKKKVSKPKAKAKAKRAPKPEVKPWEFKKLERITYNGLFAMDPCHEGLVWYDKAIGRGNALVLKPDAVPEWFAKSSSAIEFDLLWPTWLLNVLSDKLIDQMNLNYDNYRKECMRIARVVRTFNREASKAARESSLAVATIQTRIQNCIVLCQTMIVTYNKL